MLSLASAIIRCSHSSISIKGDHFYVLYLGSRSPGFQVLQRILGQQFVSLDLQSWHQFTFDLKLRRTPDITCVQEKVGVSLLLISSSWFVKEKVRLGFFRGSLPLLLLPGNKIRQHQNRS